MGQFSITQRDSWGRFKRNVVRLIVEALLILRTQTELAKGEVPLNRTLALCFVDANLNLKLDYQPTPEAKNFPHFVDVSKAVRENNIPDFSWNITDHANRCNRNVALECKRLGKPSSKAWILNRQYVEEGILRFFKAEEGYSKGCELGAMVGYVQNMEFEDILQEVNEYLNTCGISMPTLTPPEKGWQNQGVSQLDHNFVRSFIPSSFSLYHFWVDIRDWYSNLGEQEDEITSENDAIASGDTSPNSRSKGAKKRTQKTSIKVPSQLPLPIDQGD